jgi:transcriptional regulator with XRE-family HTH domain
MLDKKLRELRNSLQLTQQEVADKLHISRVRYNQYETGKRQPDNDMLKVISNFYKVSVDYLLDNEKTTLDEELHQLLNDPDTLVAFKDFNNLSDTDKQEIINFIKFKKQQSK